jgi:hypothetical protein
VKLVAWASQPLPGIGAPAVVRVCGPSLLLGVMRMFSIVSGTQAKPNQTKPSCKVMHV